MKRLIYRVKMILRGNGGESVMEGLVSIMIFALMMIAVTAMIATAQRITQKSLDDAVTRQGHLNEAVLERYSDTGTLSLEDAASGIDVDITVNLTDNADNVYIAFAP